MLFQFFKPCRLNKQEMTWNAYKKGAFPSFSPPYLMSKCFWQRLTYRVKEFPVAWYLRETAPII